jgi:hypothetical protein
MVADVGLQVFSLASRPAARTVLQKCLDRFGMMPEELRRFFGAAHMGERKTTDSKIATSLPRNSGASFA